MYLANDDIKNALQRDGRTFRARLTMSDGTIVNDVVAITSSAQSTSSTECLDFGSAISTILNVTSVDNGLMVTDKEFLLEIGIVINEAVSYVPMGYYTAQKSSKNSGQLAFEAYDRMAGKIMTSDYVSDLTYPCDIADVCKEIEKKTGFKFKDIPSGIEVPIMTVSTDEDVKSVTYAKPFDGYTYAQSVGMIAGRLCKFATFNRQGEIEFRTYKKVEDVIVELADNGEILSDSDNVSLADKEALTIGLDDIYLGGITEQDSNFTIQFLKCSTDSDNVLVSGEGVTGCNVNCNFVKQGELDGLYDKINETMDGVTTYSPSEIEIRGNMCLDLGDIVEFETETGEKALLPIMGLKFDFDGGLTTTISSYGSTGQSNSNHISPTEKALARAYQKIAIVEQLIATKKITVGAIYNYANILENSLTLVGESVTLNVTSLSWTVSQNGGMYVAKANINADVEKIDVISAGDDVVNRSLTVDITYLDENGEIQSVTIGAIINDGVIIDLSSYDATQISLTVSGMIKSANVNDELQLAFKVKEK